MSSPLRMDSSEHRYYTGVGSKKSERTVICPHLISKYGSVHETIKRYCSVYEKMAMFSC